MCFLFKLVLRWIPTASLAAILVYTGYKLFDWKVVFGTTQVLAAGKCFIYAATVVVIVAANLLAGATGIHLLWLSWLSPFPG